MFIITEKMDMDLLQYLNTYHDKLTEYDIFRIFRKITKALNYCHRNNLIHMDVKPENILLNVDEKGNIVDLRLADFGLAAQLSSDLHP